MRTRIWSTPFIIITGLLLTFSNIESSSQYFRIIHSRFRSWGLSNPVSGISIQKAWKVFRKKRNVLVAVIDTGIDNHHPFLKDNLRPSKGETSLINYGIDFSGASPDTRPFDEHGHGTHVSGIIKSVFPEVQLIVLKYYSPKNTGSQNLQASVKAIEYATKKGVDIINYSGGGPGPSPEEKAALMRATQKGILVVAAAGNEGQDIDNPGGGYYPASYTLPNIISVAGHNREAKLVSSSNWGHKSVDISAPGSRIRSSVPFSRVAMMTGTSQATAFVTGVAALLMAHDPLANHNLIKEIIVKSATPSKYFKTKTRSQGLLNAHKALQNLDKIREKRKILSQRISSL